MANTVPDTENTNVAALSIAWEIVKATYVTAMTTNTKEAGAKEITNAVIKSYYAITHLEPISK